MSRAPKAAKAKAGGKGKAAARPKAGTRAPRTGGWWAGLCCGVLLLVSPGTSIVLGVLLLPGLGGLAVGGRMHPTPRAMLLFGLSGSVPTLVKLFAAGATVDAAWFLLRRPATLLEAWAAAGAGWLVIEATAIAVGTTWLIQDGIRKKQSDREIATIEAEWGPLR